MEENRQIRVLTKSVIHKDADYFEPCCVGIAKELNIKITVFRIGTRNWFFWSDTLFKLIITGEPAMLDIFEENY